MQSNRRFVKTRIGGKEGCPLAFGGPPLSGRHLLGAAERPLTKFPISLGEGTLTLRQQGRPGRHGVWEPQQPWGPTTVEALGAPATRAGKAPAPPHSAAASQHTGRRTHGRAGARTHARARAHTPKCTHARTHNARTQKETAGATTSLHTSTHTHTETVGAARGGLPARSAKAPPPSPSRQGPGACSLNGAPPRGAVSAQIPTATTQLHAAAPPAAERAVSKVPPVRLVGSGLRSKSPGNMRAPYFPGFSRNKNIPLNYPCKTPHLSKPWPV